jgi:hypothetical protein
MHWHAFFSNIFRGRGILAWPRMVILRSPLRAGRASSVFGLWMSPVAHLSRRTGDARSFFFNRPRKENGTQYTQRTTLTAWRIQRCNRHDGGMSVGEKKQ